MTVCSSYSANGLKTIPQIANHIVERVMPLWVEYEIEKRKELYDRT